MDMGITRRLPSATGREEEVMGLDLSLVGWMANDARGDGCRVEELRRWIEQQTRLPVNCQILMTTRGKNVKTSSLGVEVRTSPIHVSTPPVPQPPRRAERKAYLSNFQTYRKKSSSTTADFSMPMLFLDRIRSREPHP